MKLPVFLKKSLQKTQQLEKVLVSDEPSQIEKIAKYDGMRPNETHVSTAQVPHSRYGNVYVHHFSSDDGTNARHLVSMFHDPTRHGVSILLAARENKDKPMRVYAAATHPNFRGNRLNYLALKEAVKSHGKLYSDVMQTKGAFKNWTNLQKEPGFKVNMTKPFREGSSEDASLQSHIAQFNPALLRRSEDMYKSLYSPYEELEKSEKLPHYLKFMGDHPKAQETAQWADDNLKHRNIAEFAMRHAKTSTEGLSDEHKSTIKHFNDSLHMPEVQKAAGMLTSKHDFNSGVQLLKDAEAAYQKRHTEEAPKLVPMRGTKVLDFGDGVAVYNLGKSTNEHEAVAMGHCATPHEGGELWSIRRDHGNGMVEPLVTISHEKGYIGEMKGKHNWKPSTKHHGHISKLLASDIIKGFVGGGYAPESNFEFSDLNEGLRKKLLDYKPALTQKVYKETLPKGFQDYSHTPEIKSIFNTNDIEAQIKYLSNNRLNFNLHEGAAGNPNIHPDVLRWLIQNHPGGHEVHHHAATNPSIHPEDLRELIQKNKADSSIHRYAAQNLSIRPDVLRELIEKNAVDSSVHQFAAQNLGIHPDVLRELIQKNNANSDVHSLAATNPSIHQKDLRELIQKNEAGSYVHHFAARNRNIHPDVLRELIQKNKAESSIHRYAAGNPNIHPEDLQWLIQNNKADTDVHWIAARNPNIHQKDLRELIQKNKADSSIHRDAAQNLSIRPDVLRELIEKNAVGSYVHHFAAQNPNIHPDVLRELIQKNNANSDVHSLAARNPQFKNLPSEIQQIVKPPRPLQKENIQKLISIMNDESNPQLAQQAHKEVKERRKEKYDRILSPEGNVEDIQHLSESHNKEMSERAKEELKRRGLRKSQQLQKTERLKKAPIMNEGNEWRDPARTSLSEYEIEDIKEGTSKNHKVKTFNLSNNLYHHVIISNNNFAEHIISDNENPFAEGITRVAGEVNKNGHLVIGGSQTNPYYQNKGYGKLAYTQALKYHNGLISDVDLSHTANSIWKHLKTLPDVNVSFGKKGTSQRHFATLKNPNNMEKAITPEQQKENIKKQRQLKNKEIIAKLKSKIVDKESAAPTVKPHLLMPKDDSPYGIPVYLKTHKDHDSLAGVHVHVSKLPELKNYSLLDHPEIDKALDKAEEKGHKAVYVSADSKPTIELRPQPDQDFDVDPEILESMKERLKPQKPKSHLKLIKALWSAPKVVNGQYAKPFSMGGTKKDKKPIQSHFSHPDHAKFNAQEHLDAYWRHQDKIKQNPKMESSLVNFHKQQAQQHWDKSKELVDTHDTSRQIKQ